MCTQCIYRAEAAVLERLGLFMLYEQHETQRDIWRPDNIQCYVTIKQPVRRRQPSKLDGAENCFTSMMSQMECGIFRLLLRRDFIVHKLNKLCVSSKFCQQSVKLWRQTEKSKTYCGVYDMKYWSFHNFLCKVLHLIIHLKDPAEWI